MGKLYRNVGGWPIDFSCRSDKSLACKVIARIFQLLIGQPQLHLNGGCSASHL